MFEYSIEGSANFTELFSTYLQSYSLPSTLDVMPEDDSGISFKDRFIQRNYYKEIGSETEELFTMHLAIKCQECVNKYLWKIQTYINNRDKFLSRIEKLEESITETHSGTDTDTKEYTGSDTTTETGTRTIANNGVDTNEHNDYYNPVSSSSNNIIGKNTDSITYGKSETETPDITNTLIKGTKDTKTLQHGENVVKSGYKEKLMYFAKSYPDLMKIINELDNLYEEALEYLDILFMGVL